MKLQAVQKIFISFLFSISTAHAVDIPTGLNFTDMLEVADTLGSQTSTKFLSQPMALGGYEGLEMGLSSEFINTGDLARLGDTAQREDTFQFQRLTVGKGIFNNVDLYLHFAPFSENDSVTEYGGMARWMFYESTRLPFSLSFLGHYSSFDMNDSFLNEAIGWDLMGGLSLENFSIYFGGGNIKSKSTFGQNLIDCATPPNCSADVQLNQENTFEIKSSDRHSFFGAYFKISNLFFAAQIDRYSQPVYSGKLGLHF